MRSAERADPERERRDAEEGELVDVARIHGIAFGSGAQRATCAGAEERAKAPFNVNNRTEKSAHAIASALITHLLIEGSIFVLQLGPEGQGTCAATGLQVSRPGGPFRPWPHVCSVLPLCCSRR